MSFLLSENPGDWIYLEETDSTSSWIAREKTPGGTLVTARKQTSGRGRAGRSWVSSEEDSLVFSFCLEGDPRDLHNIALIPLTAGIALIQTVKQSVPVNNSEYFIKWPNDLYIRRNSVSGKAAGILTESDWPASGKIRVTAGIGINFTGAPQESELKNPKKAAISLFPDRFADQNEKKIDFLKAFTVQLNLLLKSWILSPGDPAEISYEVNRCLWREDPWTDESGRKWKVADVASDGRLRVFDPSADPPEYCLISQAE